MRDCPDGLMRDRLPLYVSGRLDARSSAEVEAHLAGCADCAAEVELLRSVDRAYGAVPVDVAAIIARIPARPAVRPAAFHRQPLWRVAAAVTFMIAGTATVLAIREARTGVDVAVQPPRIDTSATPVPVKPVTPNPTVAAPPQRVAQAQTTAPAPAPQQVATATSVRPQPINFGFNLADLSDAQLEALAKALDRMDTAVSTEPASLASPLVNATEPQAGGRKNQ